MVLIMSGKRGSNPRPQAWEACALPTELLPQSFIKIVKYYFLYIEIVNPILPKID